MTDTGNNFGNGTNFPSYGNTTGTYGGGFGNQGYYGDNFGNANFGYNPGFGGTYNYGVSNPGYWGGGNFGDYGYNPGYWGNSNYGAYNPGYWGGYNYGPGYWYNYNPGYRGNYGQGYGTGNWGGYGAYGYTPGYWGNYGYNPGYWGGGYYGNAGYGPGYWAGYYGGTANGTYGYGRAATTSGNFGYGPYAGVGPQGYQRSDQRIQDDVYDRLAMHPYLDAANISVDANNGVVTLTGMVDSRWAKRTAEDIAWSVFGVTDVNDQLNVRHWQGQQGQATGGRHRQMAGAGA